MKLFVEGVVRHQASLFPDCLEDWIAEDNPVRVIDAVGDTLNLGELGFCGVSPRPQGVPLTIPLLCSNSMFMVISMQYNQADALNVKQDLMLSSCGCFDVLCLTISKS